MAASVPAVVSVEWLKEQLDSQNSVSDSVRVLDVTWYSAKDAQEEYKAKHIKYAAYFSPFQNAENNEIFPRNIPEEKAFEEYVRSMGINNDTHVVVYDQEGQNGFFIGGRAWWTFKVYGLEKVSVLNGGLQKWESMGYPTTQEIPTLKKGNFTAKYNKVWRQSFEDAHGALGKAQFADSRAAEKYNAGHVKGAASVPFKSLFEGGVMKKPEEIKAVFAENGIDLSKPVITSCTTGMSSTTLALAANVAGAKDVSVFHGGMTEWKAKADAELIEK